MWVGIRNRRRYAGGSGRRGRPGHRCGRPLGQRGVSRTAGHYWLKDSGGVRPRPRAPRPALRLSLAEREEISRGLAKKESLTSIAARLGRSVSTVSREVRRNTASAGYRAHQADRMADARTRRPRPGKLASTEALRERVEQGLKAKWSPQQISARLWVDFPDDPTMHVSHETIYTSLFVQAKGGLPGELTVHLRTRRVRRKAQRRVFVGPRRIADMRPLHARPAEIEGRLVIGHWEGDLIVGRKGLSHIRTLVERHSRYVVLLHLPSSRTDDVIEILTWTVTELPQELRRTLLGPGERDDKARPLHRDRRDPGLLLRAPLAVATGFHREHQRPAPAVLPEGDRPVCPHRCGPPEGRSRAEQPASQGPRMEDSCGGSDKPRCDDCLRPPSLRGQYSGVADNRRGPAPIVHALIWRSMTAQGSREMRQATPQIA